MYGAGTTWTHNALLNVLQKRGLRTHAGYAEKLGLPLLLKFHNHDALLIKTHSISLKDEGILCASNAKLLVPVRDPRDAVCSLMNRFFYTFDQAAARVERCAENILDVQLKLPHEVFKYEDHFIEQSSSIHALTHAVGLRVDNDEADTIHESLKLENVHGQVAKSVGRGSSYWLGYDRQTQWHRNHIGDGKIGKFKTALSIGQNQVLDDKFAKFLREFEYA